ncbi:MAG: hypothetical protein DME94_07590 [Verrucomicrobia bacterium]|nr:MAG: hypothetical protein DME94_07590 [Verrucomicrobiota bacterium]
MHCRSYSIDAKSQPACDLRALYSDGGRAAVHRGKGNRLSPPTWIGAMLKKFIDQRVVQLTGINQVIT